MSRNAGGFRVIAIFAIIPTAFAAPSCCGNFARMHARETAAISAIRTVHTVQVQYYAQYGRYATSLTQLGPPTSGAASAASANLIDSGMAAGVKQGYRFNLKPVGDGYVIHAAPVDFGIDGSKTYYSDQSMVVRQNYGAEPATANSPEVT